MIDLSVLSRRSNQAGPCDQVSPPVVAKDAVDDMGLPGPEADPELALGPSPGPGTVRPADTGRAGGLPARPDEVRRLLRHGTAAAQKVFDR